MWSIDKLLENCNLGLLDMSEPRNHESTKPRNYETYSHFGDPETE